MPTKKKKSRKQRGSRYCGYGQVGQHRKSGMRGGKGKAGGRKHFWIHTVKYDPDRYLNKGFKPPSSKLPPPETINVGELDERITSGKIEPEGGVIDLEAMGIDKLLGRGTFSHDVNVKVEDHSSGAERKITNTGGEIITK